MANTLLRAATVALGACLLIGFVTAGDQDAAKLGLYTDRLIVANQTLVLEPAVNEAVSQIGLRLAAASGNALPSYSFRILSSPQVNVFSSDGGFVYVSSGMLDTCSSLDELAALLAREIVHTNGSHHARFIREEQRKRRTGSIVAGLLGFAAAFGASYVASQHGDNAFFLERGMPTPYYAYTYGDSTAAGFAARMLYDLGPKFSEELCSSVTENAIRGYGQKLEIEADERGLEILARAGFEPGAMLRILEKLKTLRDQMTDQSEAPVSNPMNAAPGLEKRMERIRASLRQEAR